METPSVAAASVAPVCLSQWTRAGGKPQEATARRNVEPKLRALGGGWWTADPDALYPTVLDGPVIDVRELRPDDWRLWRKVRRAALAEAPTAFGSTLAEWSGAGDTERRWRARLESVPLNLILTLDSEPVGIVSAGAPSEDDGTVELFSFWVSPVARGRGVGDAAIAWVLAWARREHRDSPIVLSVRTDNDHARRLYARNGFADDGPSPHDPDRERLMRWTEAHRAE